MPKPHVEVLPLEERRTGSRSSWLYTQLRAAILEGRLAPGSRMPSTRALAQTYDVARGTVVAVFEQLSAEGYLEGRSGSGTFVAGALPEQWTRVSTAGSIPAVPRRVPRPDLSARGRELSLGGEAQPGKIPRAFQAHRPALDRATVAVWRRLSSRVVAHDPAIFWQNDPRGYRPLRAAIAEHLRTFRDIRCDEEQVLVFSGVQQSLDLTSRMLTDVGDVALVEDPGYTGVRTIFRANGLRIVPLPVDEHGANIEAAGPEAERSRLAFVTPAHQYPLGMTLPVGRRLALLRWAARTGAYVFEDDYDGEYRFAGRPIAALQGLDENQRVIYSGTFSKVLFTTVRLSYLVVPEHLVDAFVEARSTLDRYPAPVPQMILADFIAEGHFVRHLRRMRELYADRLETFKRLFGSYLGDWFELEPVSTGLQIVAWSKRTRSDVALAAAALERDVEVLALTPTGIQPPSRGGLLLGFGGFDEAETLRGLKALRRAVDAPEATFAPKSGPM